MMNGFVEQLANMTNNFFWGLHLSLYPEKKKEMQRIQDDIFLTEKAKKIAIEAYKKELYLNFEEARVKQK